MTAKPSAETAIASLMIFASFATHANADILQAFDNRGDWLAGISDPLTIEDFEDAALGQFDAPTAFSSGLTVNALGDDPFVQVTDFANSPTFQNTSPGGEQYLFFNDLDSDYTAQFLLPQSTSAFGFDIVNWRPARPGVSPQGAGVELYNNGDLVIGFFLPSDLDEIGNVSFVGFTSSEFEFDEIRFTVISGGPGQPLNANPVCIDQVSWVVPTPGTASVLAIAGLTACRRRR